LFDSGGFPAVARIISSMFLLLQILLLIDFGYRWNEDWVNRAYADSVGDEASDKKWLFGVLGASAFMYIGSFVGIGLMYSNYNCHTGFITSTLVGLVLFTVLSVFREKLIGIEGAILPSAVVAAYTTYLTWTALQSQPDLPGLACKPAGNSDTLHTVLGIIIAACSLVWTALSATRGAESLVTGVKVEDAEEEASLDKPFYRVDNDGKTVAASQATAAGNKDIESQGNEGEEGKASSKHWLFHLILMTASMYMAMVITNWGVKGNVESSSTEATSVGNTSMRVKFACSVLTQALYLWTLVAPKVLDRDFD